MRRLAVIVLCALGCAGPPPAPPTAVIDATPETICRDDGFTTRIDLSGSRSSAALSLVPAPPDPTAPPLEFRWSLDGADHDVIAGATDRSDVSIVTAGDRPLHATLTVTVSEGGSATSLVTIAIEDCGP